MSDKKENILKIQSDVLILGTGLAGLFTALKSAESLQVLLVSKAKIQDTNSQMAQGGIAAVYPPPIPAHNSEKQNTMLSNENSSDSFEQHIADTLLAGAGLSKKEIVKQIVEEAPARIEDLVRWGVNFDNELTKEGGHSHRRILHIGDHTGADIQNVLLNLVKKHPNIKILEDHCAIDLITDKKISKIPNANNRCYGAYVLNNSSKKVISVLAKTTVLATGGAGKIYLYTSNWQGATGDGIAMAYRAGARVANLEFMQFHPTCLYHPNERNFLISEAVRGEGGKLVNHKNEDFMASVHPLGALAPRDIVARAIDSEMKKSGAKCVFLDISHRPAEFIEKHFPQILKRCLELGIDIRKQAIPVVPAAHYLCGGVLTSLSGETDIPGLLVVGESACTGLHGANRLASNSLLECTVMGHRAAQLCKDSSDLKNLKSQDIPEWQYFSKNDSDEMAVIGHLWDEIRNLMWNYMGIVRSNKRLERAAHRLDLINDEINEYYWDFSLHKDILELRNIALVAKLSLKCALKRKESIGIHFNIDYPENKGQPTEDSIC